MGRPKQDTVGSFVKNGEVIKMTVVVRDHDKRWECSCGTNGAWVERALHSGVLAHGWTRHVHEAHQEFEL